MSQRLQPVSKHPANNPGASKHRRNTAAGRHRRITAEMQRRGELNKRRAMLVKCVASVGAVAALSGGVSTAATGTLASSGAGAGPESAAKQNPTPARVPTRSTSATAPASRSLTRTLSGISGGALGGARPSTDLVDPAAYPRGDGPRPKTRSATSVPKVTKVVPATANVAAKAVAKAASAATTTKTTTTSGSTTKKGSRTSGSGSTTSGSGGTSGGSGGSSGSGSGSGSGTGGGTVPPVSPPIVLSGDQPGPGNTGVPAGTALTVMNGDLTITTAGATYSGLDIHGYLRVEAPNVTVKNSIIRGGTGPVGNGIVNDTTPSATNFLLEDSEVVPQYPVVNLDDIKGYNYTALRDNIHGSVDGLKMYGNNATVQDSWIHDLVTYAHDPAQNNGPSHSDGVQILSGTNLKVLGNTIEGQPNSSVIITQDNGPVSNVLIDGNWLSGLNQVATIKLLNKPLPTLSGITVTNNIFNGQLASACQILDSPAVTLVQSGNVIGATNAAAKLLRTASTS